MTDYRDKVAIVTGAASRIGLAPSERLALRGALLTLPDIECAPLEKAAETRRSESAFARTTGS